MQSFRKTKQTLYPGAQKLGVHNQPLKPWNIFLKKKKKSDGKEKMSKRLKVLYTAYFTWGKNCQDLRGIN